MHALILALHEDPTNSQQVLESLKLSGHTVIECKSFADAIKILDSQRVDMIISDVHLENGGNVFDFLRWVKHNPSTRETPFVMFSSKPTQMAKFVEDGVRTSARMLGATTYITMEIFDSDEFRKLIDPLLPPGNQVTKLTVKAKGE